MRRLIFHIALSAGIILMSVSCACGRKSDSGKADAALSSGFPMPKVPAMLNDDEKIEYVASHFWAAFTDTNRRQPCRDTSIVSGVSRLEVEQAMANFAVLMGQLPLETTDRIMADLADRLIANEMADTSSNVLEELTAMTERYFYDPNSPVRDEDIYHIFSEKMSTCGFFTQKRREAFAHSAAMTALNRRGTKAADFSFSDRNGRTYTLYGIKAAFTILFFSNPGCTACKDIIDSLNGIPVIAETIDEGKVAVLNIYIDEELDEWYKYMPIYPESWYNGYDHNCSIRTDELYDARAIPSLYLLDADKTVILKDVPLERMMNTLIPLLEREGIMQNSL